MITDGEYNRGSLMIDCGGLGGISDTLASIGMSMNEATFDWTHVALLGGIIVLGTMMFRGTDVRRIRARHALDREYKRHSKRVGKIQSKYKVGIQELGSSRKRIAAAA